MENNNPDAAPDEQRKEHPNKGKGKVWGKPYQPGQSGNLLGRKPKGNAWADVINQYLDASEITQTLIITSPEGTKINEINLKSKNISLRHDIIARLIQNGLKGDFKAIEMLMDRTIGKALSREFEED